MNTVSVDKRTHGTNPVRGAAICGPADDMPEIDYQSPIARSTFRAPAGTDQMDRGDPDSPDTMIDSGAAIFTDGPEQGAEQRAEPRNTDRERLRTDATRTPCDPATGLRTAPGARF